ncbi:MAG TPA: outer membrane protein transport protein [Calditrichia bacterium]|nr:outer membrane protein transport protein [Calditrichia bacterium]
MLSFKNSRGILSVLLLAVTLTSSLWATNGYFRHGYGIHYRGLAGAGVALSLSPMGMASNPAGIVFLQRQLDLGLAFFNPNRDYTVSGSPSGFPFTFPLTPGTVESGSTLFPIPFVGFSYSLDDNNALGFALYGNGGMNTDYDAKTFNDPRLDFSAPTGVNLNQLFVSATYSRQIVPGHALGISGIFAYQMFKAEGLLALSGFSGDPTHFTNNDNASSTGFGARIGYMGHFGEYLSVGASYQTLISMSEFSEYAGLFAEGGKFDIPANWVAGVAVKITPQLTVAADIQQILYSGVPAIANPMDLENNPPYIPNPNADPTDPSTFMMLNPNFVPLGSDDDLAWGFGWDDILVFKFGAQYQLATGTWLRAGFSTGDQPVQESEVLFNILAPGVIKNHLTFGASHQINPRFTLNGGFMYGFSEAVVGNNPFEAPSQQEIEIQMNQMEFELGLSINL